ncbi:MAG: glycoside hydrolase family 15 protein, partial [Nitrospirae bacterium]
MYKKISDYGIIGNLHTVALIAKDGSIDWLCLPYIDSPGVFNALLDARKGGNFALTPIVPFDSAAEYIEDTNVLITRFRTSSAQAELTDFMPVCTCAPGSDEKQVQEIYRRLKMLSGKTTFKLLFRPAFDYARADTEYKIHPHGVQAYSAKDTLTLVSSLPFRFDEKRGEAEFHLKEGDILWFRLRYDEKTPERLDEHQAEEALKETIRYWQGWLNQSETGRRIDPGPYKKMLNRSALVLKLLYYEPTGTISAAATTSLPEAVGGERNWDYRYTWVRDASLTLQALFNLGHMSETEGFIRWIERLLSERDVSEMQIMYGLRGEHEIQEMELPHLEGYRESRPVRVGNAASSQRQLDIYGELMDAVMRLSSYVGKIDSKLWPFLKSICDYVCEHWQEKDYGIWEVRGGPYHFVHSKVMCWVALDRGVRIARMYGFRADLKRWQKTMKEIKKEVFMRGWSEKKKSFIQHYETDALDSSALLFPFYGFLDFNDPMMLSTVQ